MPSIISTLACDVDIVFYEQGNGGKPYPQKTVTIKGGAGIADQKTLVTPEGVMTSVSDDDLTLLESHPVFQAYLANGVIQIVKRGNPNMEKRVKDMDNDKSAPLVPEDFAKQGKSAPSTTA